MTGRLAILLLLGAAVPARAQSGADRYDDVFRKYSKRFFGVGHDWRMFKAQAMTESRLDPEARSQVGARGVMQLMPTTFREIQSRNPEWASIDDAEWNIAGGIFHDRELWRMWRPDVDGPDHHRFMFGSYNAGRIPLLTAQRIARDRQLDARTWPAIETVAPSVPRWRHRETLQYVDRIAANLARLDSKGRVRRN